MDWRRWASIARLTIRKMSCLNGSRKSHFVRKIKQVQIETAWGRIYFLRICAIFCRYWTCSFSGRNNQAIGPRLSAIFTFFFTMQSYEKEIWHCPHLSAYVRKCPLLSAFLLRCKVTKKKFGTVQPCPAMSICVQLRHNNALHLRCKVTKSKFGNVQICPILSNFVHLIFEQFHLPLKLFSICAILH